MLLSFTLRIIIAYLIVIGIMFATVYQQHHSRMEDYVSQRFADVMTQVRAHLAMDESEPVSEEMREVLQSMQIPYLEAYDGKGRLLHTFASGNWASLKDKTPLPALPAGEEENFTLIDHDRSPYLVFATGPAQIKNPFGRHVVRAFRGVLPVDEGIIRRMREHYANALWLVLATGAVFALALFPMILFYYRQLRLKNSELIRSYFGTVSALGSAVAQRDSGTSSHSFRVTLYTLRLAEALQCCSQKHIANIILGAYLHDIGKIGIPDAILLKPDKLTADEFELMKSHVEKGLEIVSHVTWLSNAGSVIAGHHEKYDGSGYPHGLRGEAIPLEARIFSVADVFDALSSRRPYKAPMTLEASLDYIKNHSGTHFDPAIVAVFIRIAPGIYRETLDRNAEELEAMLQKEVEPYINRL
ncbi:HD domain-containing protein [Sulfurimonas sp. HSL-3221]|uniref:HD-GYP domain-containing protein n=1 Tax=Sulfurimonadaceae TaxID=2771471 RepID=UPI001E431234|nr:HD domain-containing phosphohydrolase [Sulfurimonas sp. HSL-3221]UFS63697.1 HD domain-containing protein [Sulfurimonas sp. HSL-3221]